MLEVDGHDLNRIGESWVSGFMLGDRDYTLHSK